MKLLTQEIKSKIPKLYAQEKKGTEAIVHVKFFTPWTSWTWYATEGEAQYDDEGNEIDFLFFGLVEGFETELGYFSLKEFESVTGPCGLKIERDMYFRPCTIKEIRERRARQ